MATTTTTSMTILDGNSDICKKQGDMQHNASDGQHNDSKGRHGDGKRQQGNSRRRAAWRWQGAAGRKTARRR
jgi:hypothetical protein